MYTEGGIETGSARKSSNRGTPEAHSHLPMGRPLSRLGAIRWLRPPGRWRSGKSQKEKIPSMTWIKTVPQSEADDKLRWALEAQRALYPKEYATPVQPTGDGTSGIVASHSLIPDALYHAFSTFGVLMSPELPLTRAQHEMITTMVSVTNRCRY